MQRNEDDERMNPAARYTDLENDLGMSLCPHWLVGLIGSADTSRLTPAVRRGAIAVRRLDFALCAPL